ncbi:AAA family ATPase [Candidatus Saccharibacteria bacterium]|nr:AAA family ATPase [Candidatus Saccharibacteria bacterium]
MKLIGLSGTNGSGKDTIGQLLDSRHNFLFVSMTDMLREEAMNRKLGTSREVLRTISAEWRRELGLGVLVDKAVEHYRQQGGDDRYVGLVIASLRNPGENDRVHELGGEVVWIDANPRVRYDRLKARMRADDPQSFEEFLAHEQAEMDHSGDEATLSMRAVKEKSDRVFQNEYPDLDTVDQAVTDTLL